MDIKDFRLLNVDEDTEKKLLGIQGVFLKGKKREDVLTSKLVEHTIRMLKKEGTSFSKEEIDKIKFAFDPIFKQKVIDKVHQECDKEYQQSIAKCENAIKSLEKLKSSEMKRIEEARWENIIDKNLRYNLTEGKLLMNGSVSLFSSIKGAAVNINESYRVITTEEAKSKKHASVGGALVGGLMFGPVGAIVGGTALGKTKHKGNTMTNTVPTTNHVGVIVDIDGFKSEILLLSHMVDQDSNEFQIAIRKAQEIISKLQYLSSYPVPETYLKVEAEPIILDIQKRIIVAYDNLHKAKENVPKYEIPARYMSSCAKADTDNIRNYCDTITYKEEKIIEIPKVEEIKSTNYAKRFCTQCGTPVQEGANFCVKCGGKL